MKNITIKRFLAYLIDLIIIGMVSFSFSYVPNINPNQEEYKQAYEDIVSLYENYDNNKLTIDEYEQKYIALSYDLNRNNVIYTVVNLVIILLYFVLVPLFLNGQTLGKRLLKIKVVSNYQDRSVGFVSYFVRAVVQNNLIITILQIIILFTFSKDNFYFVYSKVNMVGYILLYLIVFLILIRKDSRGLHDLISGTKVVSISDEIQLSSVNEEEKKEKTISNKTKKIKEEPKNNKTKNTTKKEAKKKSTQTKK